MWFSLNLTWLFGKAATQAFIHAFLPALFKRSSSLCIEIASKKMIEIGCRAVEEGLVPNDEEKSDDSVKASAPPLSMSEELMASIETTSTPVQEIETPLPEVK